MGRDTDAVEARIRTSGDPGAATGRLVVPDVLRGVAIIAMLVAHASPFLPEKPAAAAFVTAMLSELASPLFVLVMGMSAQLVWNSSARTGTTLLQQAVRGVVLIALGVWMTSWGSWVAVILACLGLVLIVGVPLIRARTSVLLAVGAVLLLIGQPLMELARTWTWVYTAPAPVREVMVWLLLGPQYRVLSLLPFFLLGAVLIRHGFRRDALLWTMAGIGVVTYLSWGLAVRAGIAETVSGNSIDTARDVGLVCVAYVCVVLAAVARGPRARRFWDAVFLPIRACGRLALSLYLLHVALIGFWASAHGHPVADLWAGWLVIVPGMVLVGWGWWRFVGTGPVEWLLGAATRRTKPLPFVGTASRR